SRTRRHSERLVQAIGTPNRNVIVTRLLYPYEGIAKVRQMPRAFGILRDEKPINPDLLSAIETTGVQSNPMVTA
ncbi:MAG: hypothetical protein ACTSPX_05815, partial [Candidatus Thorarchaeota archaeon]